MRVFDDFPSILDALLKQFWAPNVPSIWSMIVRHAWLARSGLNIGFHCNLLLGSVIGLVGRLTVLKVSVRRKGFVCYTFGGRTCSKWMTHGYGKKIIKLKEKATAKWLIPLVFFFLVYTVLLFRVVYVSFCMFLVFV